jgi:hypothetical protein
MTARLSRCAVLAAVLCVASSPAAFGQLTREIDALRVPAAPAFTLLGIEPASVERPGTYRALFASALSAARDRGLPDSWALEAAPYWLAPRPGLTVEAMRNAGIIQTIRQTFAVSVVTSSYELGTDGAAAARTGKWIGGGARVQLADGSVDAAVVGPLEAELRSLHTQCLLRDDTEACIEELAVSDVALRIQAAARRTTGFVFELAAAIVGDIPTDTARQAHVSRFGAWVTPAWRTAAGPEIIAVGRFVHDVERATDANVWDAGGRLHWELPLLALSGELLHRWVRPETGAPLSSTRYGGMIEIQINNDWYATYSFGRGHGEADFAPGTATFYSTLSINVGAGRKPLLKLM